MTHRLLAALAAAVALSACEPVATGDDAAVGLAIGAVQPALEAQTALLTAIDACTDCTDLDDLRGHLQTTLGACATVRAFPSAKSACTWVNGRSALEVAAVGCDLGLGRAVSGTVLVAQADGSTIRHFETDVVLGDHGVVACGQISGGGPDHHLAFEAVAHGTTGGDVLISWSGPTRVREGVVEREGTIGAQFTGSDGVGYLVQGEASGLRRADGNSLPHAGRIAFQGTDGAAAIEFAADTPTTGGIRLLRSDGRTETLVVAR